MRVLLPLGLDLAYDYRPPPETNLQAGDFVEVRKAESKPATRVVFAPAQQNLRLQGSTNALKRSVASRGGVTSRA